MDPLVSPACGTQNSVLGLLCPQHDLSISQDLRVQTVTHRSRAHSFLGHKTPKSKRLGFFLFCLCPPPSFFRGEKGGRSACKTRSKGTDLCPHGDYRALTSLLLWFQERLLDNITKNLPPFCPVTRRTPV